MTFASPLRRVLSLKTKLSVVIVAAVAVTASISIIGSQLGWPVWIRPLIAGALALAMVQLLARGMIRPLREMDLAARSMAAGDYGRRIETASVDEVGRLADAFNAMGHQLAGADRLRRDLLANVAHELRTPLTGVKATLENLADGIAQPTPEVLAVMAAQVDRLGRLVTDVLDLSRLEAGELVMRPEALDVSNVVDAALSELRLTRRTATALPWR